MRPAFTIALLVTACGNAPSTDMLGCTVVDGVCLLPTTNKPTPTPNEACLTTPIGPGGGPAHVALTGFVHVFSGGPDTKGTSVAVFDATPLLAGMGIASTTPLAIVDNIALDPATQRACDADPKNGCSLPSMTGCAAPVCNDGLNGDADDGKYCRDNGGGDFSCNARLRWEARYTTGNVVPTDHQLVIRVTGPGAAPDSVWSNAFTWNVYIPSNARACTSISDDGCLDLSGATPTYQLNVNALSRQDYEAIPINAGLEGGISRGKGAVAGDVRDCDNVSIGHAVVGMLPAPDRFTYFSDDDPFHAVPVIRLDTDPLGRFAGFNLAPGKVTVAAAAGDTLADLGHFTGFVYPDSLSVFNINGGRPIP